MKILHKFYHSSYSPVLWFNVSLSSHTTRPFLTGPFFFSSGEGSGVLGYSDSVGLAGGKTPDHIESPS